MKFQAVKYTIFAATAALAGCADSDSERLQVAPLPGPVLESVISVPQGAAKMAMGRWRTVKNNESADKNAAKNPDKTTPAAPSPAAYFQTETFTMVVYCFDAQNRRKLGVVAGGTRGFHDKKTVRVKYRFDKGPMRTDRWRWYADTAARTGPAAADFARQLAKRRELRIHIQHKGAKPQKMSLKGSAEALRKVLKSCAAAKT